MLEPGRNCWRVERATRFALLIDADACFRAVRAALRTARRSIFILSWDIDSRVRLVPAGAGDGWPEPLGEFLHAVVSSRRGLRAYVLNWDFAMLYALEREWLPVYKLGWRTHRRLAFHMDGRHPIGASHHQKIVVVDDRLAFVGGLDLTRCRWDTPEHRAKDPLRCDADGRPYGPFHDVQALVEGEAAAALGELARRRWRRATGHEAVAPGRRAGEVAPWPEDVVPDLTDVEVGIARTEPAFEGRPGVHEIRELHLDAIGAARRDLYLEHQYFTSGLVGDALAATLAAPEGPEIALVSPQLQSGWLENATMGMLRARLHRRLREADGHARYRMYCPTLPGAGSDECLNVHSKVLVADDELLCVGSANLSNRSMALDTECDLALEPRGGAAARARIRGAIAHMRSRLLAEHLGTTPEVILEAHRQAGSLHAATAALGDGPRHLAPAEPLESDDLAGVLPDDGLLDPERPMAADELVARLVPHEAQHKSARRLIGLGVLALLLVGGAVAWRWTPLRDHVNVAALVGTLRSLVTLPLAPLLILIAFALAGLVVPVTLLITVTGIVFGPGLGTFYALAGAVASAGVSYALGARLGREAVRRLVGGRVNRLSRRLVERGLLTILVVRVLPVAPFTVINAVAGASHIRLRDFLLGTVLGMAPGVVLITTFGHHLAEAVRQPSPKAIAVMVLVAICLFLLAMLLRRLVRKVEPDAAADGAR